MHAMRTQLTTGVNHTRHEQKQTQKPPNVKQNPSSSAEQQPRALTVDAVVVEADHPVKALELVVAHRPELDAVRLLRQEGRLPRKGTNTNTNTSNECHHVVARGKKTTAGEQTVGHSAPAKPP